MKALRVLSGLHAGATLSLAPGRYRIASAAAGETGGDPQGETELTLFDWTEAPLFLQADDTGHIAVGSEPWPDLEVRRFGEVALCVGDAEGPWPDDTFLLAASQPDLDMPVSRSRGWATSWWARTAVLAAGLLAAVGALYGRPDGPASAVPSTQPAAGADLLLQSLSSRGLEDLRVRAEPRGVVLSGLVASANQGQSVRVAVADLERATGVRVVEDWEVADDVASTIEMALRLPGVHASYQGAGSFEVTGVVDDPAKVRGAAEQLRKDLGGNVRRLEFALERRKTTAPFSAAIAADSLRYSERLDGAKVFSVN